MLPKTPTKLLSNIDLLRGLAAISILFWHYQHFYYLEPGVNPIAASPTGQPLFSTFSWIYTYGAMAIEFFWILSGFVFFHVYAEQRTVSVKTFFSNRFARLFPLHWITQCLVAGLQFASWGLYGKFQIYSFNDLRHFILNIFMASQWGFQKGHSFNAPIWSISIELLTYVVFFAFLKTVGIRLLTSILWLGWSLLLYKNAHTPIFECAVLFSLGGGINQASACLVSRAKYNVNLIAGCLLLVSCGIGIQREWLKLVEGIQWGIFPALIWVGAALDEMGYSSGRIGLALGDISYPSYLLHVPVQILVILILEGTGHRTAVNSPVFLLCFVASVIILAYLTHRFVELPLKLRCKAWLNRLGDTRSPRMASNHDRDRQPQTL